MKNASLVAGAMMSLAFASFAIANDSTAQIVSAAMPSAVKETGWTLGLPQEENVVYKGVVSFDGPNTRGVPAAYLGDSAGSFLVSLIAHGLIIETIKGRQKIKLEERADKVLLPYQAILGIYSYKELMGAGLNQASIGEGKKLSAFSEKPGSGKFIQSMPVFSMTQDQKAIILENLVSVHTSGSPGAAPYQNLIKVVSQVKETTDPVEFWTTNQGEKLKAESASLFAHSLEIGVNEAAGKAVSENQAQKTFRYQEGEVLQMERGRLMSEQCNRVVIKTLRGWLMSIPVSPGASSSGPACADMVSGMN